MIHIWCPWKLSNFYDLPHPLSIYVQTSSTPLFLEVRFQTNPPPFLMITNQLKQNIIQGWLLRVTRSFLQVSFCFQYHLINLVWLFFDFFSFSWSFTTCFLVALYSCVYSCTKISRNHTWLIILIRFIRLKNSWMNPCVETEGKYNEPVNNEFKIMRKSDSLHRIMRVNK